jgi:hypothetical protein
LLLNRTTTKINCSELVFVSPWYTQGSVLPGSLLPGLGFLRQFQCRIPLADICSWWHEKPLGDELHPNRRGAKIIAEVVFQWLPKAVINMSDSWASPREHLGQRLDVDVLPEAFQDLAGVQLWSKSNKRLLPTFRN